MALLERWNPSRELERFRREFDDLFERFAPNLGWFKEWEAAPLRPAIESYADGEKFVVRVELPGVDPENLEIKVMGDVLTIKGSREEHRETEKIAYFRREMRYGSFERDITLPEGMTAEDLKAIYRNGVLELTAPMPRAAAPKEIKIQIEAAATKEANGEKKAA